MHSRARVKEKRETRNRALPYALPAVYNVRRDVRSRAFMGTATQTGALRRVLEENVREGELYEKLDRGFVSRSP